MCDDFIIISGPCSAESEEQLLQTALELKQFVKPTFFRAGIWKPRTRPGTFEGIGYEAVKWLVKVGDVTGIPVITEAGSAQHVKILLENNIKNFWIGARTVANPFSVQEIVDACEDKDINVFVKNPIYPDIELWTGAIERFLNKGIKCVAAIHRGFYPFRKTQLRNIPAWEIPIELARRFPNLKILTDPSHIAGNKIYIKEICQKAIDLNFCGIMVETHYRPESARSDKTQQITPKEFKEILDTLTYRNVSSTDVDYKSELNNLCEKIDVIDFQLIDMLEHRFKLVDEIGKLKKKHNVKIVQLDRWKSMVEARLKYVSVESISREFLLKLLQIIHKESIRRQNDIFGKED